MLLVEKRTPPPHCSFIFLVVAHLALAARHDDDDGPLFLGDPFSSALPPTEEIIILIDVGGH